MKYSQKTHKCHINKYCNFHLEHAKCKQSHDTCQVYKLFPNIYFPSVNLQFDGRTKSKMSNKPSAFVPWCNSEKWTI